MASFGVVSTSLEETQTGYGLLDQTLISWTSNCHFDIAYWLNLEKIYFRNLYGLNSLSPTPNFILLQE